MFKTAFISDYCCQLFTTCICCFNQKQDNYEDQKKEKNFEQNKTILGSSSLNEDYDENVYTAGVVVEETANISRSGYITRGNYQVPIGREVMEESTDIDPQADTSNQQLEGSIADEDEQDLSAAIGEPQQFVRLEISRAIWEVPVKYEQLRSVGAGRLAIKSNNHREYFFA